MWQTLKTETVFDSRFVKLHKDKVRLPDSKIIDDFYTVTIPNGAMVCALTSDGDIILKKEYRYACKSDIIECPAGMIEDYENVPLDAAIRELLEETGYTSDNWLYLGGTRESTSKLTNTMHLFLAENCIKTSEQKLDDTESIELLKIPFNNAIDMVMSGEIVSNSSTHLILKVARLKGL